MRLTPAILHITKPTVYSIDKKGKATMKITLLTMEHQTEATDIASTRTKKYRTFKEDQIILVSQKDKERRLYTMESVVGPTSDINHWESILPYRIGLPSVKQHRPLKLPSFHTLTPQVPPALPFRHYMLIDSPGTVDREDGIWWDSNEAYGVFTVDIPTQKGWTHHNRPCVEYLSSQLFDYYVEKHQFPHTRTFYLPSMRLPMVDPSDYVCVSEETLDQHTSIPILCYHIPKQEVFTSHIHKDNAVHFASTEDNPSTFPAWYHRSPLANLSVADCNITMNTKWFRQDSESDGTHLITKLHPAYPKQTYAPITSPIRNMGDLWNQCVLHDYLVRSNWTNVPNQQVSLQM